MSYYPPQGSHRSAMIYPATPIPGAGFPTPQLQVPQPPMMIVPSRVNSRHSHHSRLSHRSRHDNDSDYDHHYERDRDYHHERDRADYHYDRDPDRDYRHDGDRDRHHKHRSHSRHRSHHHSDRDKRHRDKDDRKRHRSHRRHHTAPQVITVPPQMAASYPGQVGVAPSVGYPGQYYDYRPSWGQRLRQFFGFAPVSPHYQYKSDTHSWGFLGRSKRPRYIDARTGVEVDKYGRTVHRI